MRYPASEKLEIIRTVEASHLPVKKTLAMLGIPSSTYYDWYARWSDGGIDALSDRSPRPRSVWNRIPDDTREHCLEAHIDPAFMKEIFNISERQREPDVHHHGQASTGTSFSPPEHTEDRKAHGRYANDRRARGRIEHIGPAKTSDG